MRTCFVFSLIISCGLSDTGFYFPDQISVRADSQSEAGVDSYGNAHSKSQGHANVQNQGNKGFTGNPHAPQGQGFSQPQFGQGYGQGMSGSGYGHNNYQDNGPGYVHQGGYQGVQNSNAQSQSSAQTQGHGGQTNSQSNAGSQSSGGLSQTQSASQSQSTGFNDKGYPFNTVSGSTSGSQTNGQGVSSASSASSVAGTTFIGGIPVATASAAAAAASAGPGGSSATSANSAAISSGLGNYARRPPDGWYLGGRIGEDSDGDSMNSKNDSDSSSMEDQNLEGLMK